MIRIATWNVNSVKARLSHLLAWLQQSEPDVVLLQELKCTEDAFPRFEIEALGYRSAVVGQKGYNGVAILSKSAIEARVDRLPGPDGDVQSRYLEATTLGLRVASIYLPNGNPTGSEKYPYKLSWLDRLRAHAAEALAHEQPLVLGGDYNVIPSEADCYDPSAWRNDALFLLETRRRFRALVHLGFTDAVRAHNPAPGPYTFWDYQQNAWLADHGIRIDHLLLSPQAADRLRSSRVDRDLRGQAGASDHVPVICELEH